MNKLEYYFVPADYIFFSSKQYEIAELDLTNWIQINIGDSLENRNEKSLWELSRETNFADYPNKVAKLLWQIKEDNEELVFKFKPTGFRKTYKLVNMVSVDNLSSYVSRAQRIQHGFIYKQNEEIRKYVNITEGELIELFAAPESKPYLVDVISKWANKTDYYKYELDLYDD